ncbi:MAG TPA: ImmA/IrrE family metallo-endopeptidase [Patescibacteria group bacterium]|nr:ImmA/IrrE family metallo-endopeptidase [Patescibacteria group bacterium]
MISDYRHQVISSKVSELHKEFKIAEYPIKMPYIFKQFYGDKVVIKQLEVNGNADVIANYDPIHDITAIIINKTRTSARLHKRLNFSLAHELGHIVLQHYRPYSNTDNPNIDYIEEEADEFAGQFLVPDKQLLIRPYVESMLSDYFFVSTAVIQKRYFNIDCRLKQVKKDSNSTKLDYIIDKYLFDI